ncbi:hypothetical protein H0H92_014183 [Tricholoma furcatifolium]|nr:hypothetical protein H0H92_014183 [Tricholoma furcatifolium]
MNVNQSLLLPSADQSDYRAWVSKVADDEPYVNGLWLSIIRYHFDDKLERLDYTIYLEKRVPKGICDLVLVKHEYSQNGTHDFEDYQIIIEGKGHAADTFDNTRTQLRRYMPIHELVLWVKDGATSSLL